jgi:hypothetical protein
MQFSRSITRKMKMDDYSTNNPSFWSHITHGKKNGMLPQ